MQVDQITHYNPIVLMHTTKEKGIGKMSRPHSHAGYEIYYLVEGERYYFIENQTYLVKKGMVVLIKPHVIHRTMAADVEAHERLLMIVEEDYFNAYTRGFLPQNWFEAFEDRGPILTLKADEEQQLFALMLQAFQMKDFMTNQKRNQLIMTVMSVLNLIDRISQTNMEYNGAPLKEDDVAIYNHIKEVATYINEHYEQDLTLTSLADLYFISPSYLSRMFKKVTGFNLKAYINQVRVLEAEKLLLTTDLTIGAIAEDVGYKSDSHFGRAFKQIKDVSPRSFRKKL